MVKCLLAIRETQFRSLGWEDLLENEMATHSSILAWEIPWTEKLAGLHIQTFIYTSICKIFKLLLTSLVSRPVKTSYALILCSTEFAELFEYFSSSWVHH